MSWGSNKDQRSTPTSRRGYEGEPPPVNDAALLEEQDCSHGAQLEGEREMDFHSHLGPHLTQNKETESQRDNPAETFTTNEHVL